MSTTHNDQESKPQAIREVLGEVGHGPQKLFRKPQQRGREIQQCSVLALQKKAVSARRTSSRCSCRSRDLRFSPMPGVGAQSQRHRPIGGLCMARE